MNPPIESATSPGAAATVPLVVDLDGTLIRTDMLHESTVRVLRGDPLAALRIPAWLARGKAALKQELARRTAFDPSLLPYNEDVLAWLREQRLAGRRLVLCTASDRSIADAIAAHTGLFDEVMASDGATNLDGPRKAQALAGRFGERGFDYAANAAVDLKVWPHARRAVVVHAPAAVAAAAAAATEVEKVFERPRAGAATWIRSLRAHHWLKNVLLFVPLFAGHQLGDAAAWVQLLWAFAAFSLCASCVYVANDLMDLESDRQHPRKRTRPFASGALSIKSGVLLVPLLALASALCAAVVGPAFFSWLSVYFALTWAYTLWLKRIVLVDCLTLAGLYMLRVVAGAAAAGMGLSFWLLAFCGFLFLSLAFVKRYAELQLQQAAGKTRAHGRAYYTSDAPLVQALGIAAGYTSVVVLALYLNSEAVMRLYGTPELVWVAVLVMVHWISWIWLRASRAEMHDDPLVFAFKDKTSLVAGALFGASILLGAMQWRW